MIKKSFCSIVLTLGVLLIVSILSTMTINAAYDKDEDFSCITGDTYKEISTDEMNEIITSINEISMEEEKGSKYVCEHYLIVYENKIHDNPRSVYSDTKTATRDVTVYDLGCGGGSTVALSFTQTVTFVVNDITNTVKITAYDASFTMGQMAGIQCYPYTGPNIYNYNSTYAEAQKRYRINTGMGNWYMYCHVGVTITGTATFTFDLIGA